jgi:hypothetical protein
MKLYTRLALVVLFFSVVNLLAQQPLNDDSVVKMVKAGLGDDVIVATIKNSPGTYSLSTDDLISLKKQGVSEKVLGAMIEKNAAPATPTPVVAVAPAAPLVDEIGIYYKDKNDKWIEILPEIVNWKTGGALKSFASRGIVKGDVNGHLQGKASKNALNTPLDFLIYTPDGVAITEYQLLHLHESGDGREFRSMTGGVVHSSSGAQRDEIDFEGKKLAPRTYEIVLGPDVKMGDFGFLPPGATSSSNLASSGKMYTFHVIE